MRGLCAAVNFGRLLLMIVYFSIPTNCLFQALMFYSRHACLKTIESPAEGRSFGSTLLIIFFSLVIFYLVLGICTKKFLMGATGIEVIPNLGFWTDLPNLVKVIYKFVIYCKTSIRLRFSHGNTGHLSVCCKFSLVCLRMISVSYRRFRNSRPRDYTRVWATEST